ncbi:MAG: sulfatase family protein, partial [Planctomycetaceae bacterium]
LSRNGEVIETEGESSQVTVNAAMGFITECADRQRPFLAVVWFGSPHLPHIAAKEDRAHYEDLPKELQHYYGEITGIDRAMGTLRRELRELGIAENTLLWYTSDNGATRPVPETSNGGLRGKKGTVWEGGLRVPAIVEWPAKISSPRTTDIPCGSVDIYPTLLELAGVSVEHQPRPLDGASLVSLFDGAMTRRDKPLGFWDFPAPGRPVRSTDLLKALRRRQHAGDANAPPPDADAAAITQTYSEDELPGHSAWIDGDWKLHRIPARPGEARYLLFNLVDDPQETQDLAAEQPERVARMKSQLEAWQASVVRSLNGADYRE